jgi:hypothetical protein
MCPPFRKKTSWTCFGIDSTSLDFRANVFQSTVMEPHLLCLLSCGLRWTVCFTQTFLQYAPQIFDWVHIWRITNRSWSVWEVIFHFPLHFPFLFGESNAKSLYAQRILDTLDFPTQTTETMPHSKATPQLKQLVTGFPLQRPRFEPRSGQVGFVVDCSPVINSAIKFLCEPVLLM